MESLSSFFQPGPGKPGLVTKGFSSINDSPPISSGRLTPPAPEELPAASKQVWPDKSAILPDSTAAEPISLAGEDDPPPADPPVATKEPFIDLSIDSGVGTPDDGPFTPGDEWLVDSPKPAKPSVTSTTATDFVPGTGSSSSSSVSVTSSSSFAAPVLPVAAEGVDEPLKERILALAREQTDKRFTDANMVSAIVNALKMSLARKTSDCIFESQLNLKGQRGCSANFYVHVLNKDGENIQLGFMGLTFGDKVDCGTRSHQKVIDELPLSFWERFFPDN